MKISLVVLLIGMVLYVISFFLTGVKVGTSGIPGYMCAYLVLLLPWDNDGFRMLHDKPVEYFAFLVSGWINPIFLITIALSLAKPNRRYGTILRIVTVLMLPACWVIFFSEHLHLRSGYFLWAASMLLALFANRFSGANRELNVTAGG